MILVKKYSGGSMSFRTSSGSVSASLKDGFLYIDVENPVRRQMQLIHKFHAPPSSFSLEKPKKDPVVEKPAKKVTAKRATKKRSKKSS